MKTSLQLREEISRLLDRVEAIVSLARNEKRDLTEDESAEVDSIHADNGNLAALEAELARVEKIEAKQAQYAAQRTTTLTPTQATDVRVVRRNVTLKAFKGESAHEDAYLSGRWLLALLGHTPSKQWCHDNGVSFQNALSEGANELGGSLVPDALESTVIRLVEEAGVARANMTVWPMASEMVTVPRRTSGVTCYYPGEGGTITASDINVDQVKLVARKLAALTVLSSEVSEDSIVALAELVALEMAYGFAVAEDQAAFLGDATSAYGGILGITNSLAAGSIVDAASTHTSYGALTLGDFEVLMGALPQFPGIRPKFYLSKPAWAASMQRLLDAAGGNTMLDLSAGAPPRFGGYDVQFVNVMSKTLTAQASQPAVIFGDLGMGALFGSRRGISLAQSDAPFFTSDQTCLRATERYDVNVHGRGTATEAGPIVMLKFAAS